MAKHLPTPYWTYEETLTRLKNIPDPYVQHMAYLYYATGARLNELMALKKTHVKRENEEKGIILVQIYTLKHSDKGTRSVPITSNEPVLFNAIKLFEESDKETYRSFQNNICDKTIQNHIKRFLGIKVHHLRHLRAHHLGKTQIPNQKTFTVKELQYYFGWKDIDTPNHYLEDATPQEIIQKLFN